MNWGWVTGILASTIRQSTPLLFVAFGTLFIQSSGIMNMAGEGFMLLSGFVAAYVTSITQNVWAGMIVATIITGIVGFFYTFVVQRFHVDQIIMGCIGSRRPNNDGSNQQRESERENSRCD
jgi:ABC-type uncharacterized transport system permease subunit